MPMSCTFNALVIDDSKDVCSTFKKVLGQLGCHVAFADTAEEGINMISLQAFDIIFVALCIRQVGARGIGRWIRYRYPRTKVMAMTSWRGELDYNILSLDGIHEVVRKPLKFNEIKKTLIKHLG